MLFNSLSFLLFFSVVYGLYRLLPHRWQNWMLLAASYVFYGSWDYRFLALIFLSTIIDYLCGLGIAGTENPRRKKILLVLSVVSNLSILGFFKYAGFFVETFNALASRLGLGLSAPALNIILPVGISFYTFQTMSYTIDVYQNKLAPERNFITFALFVSFFPQLVAGPIERARSLLPQIRCPRTVTDGHLHAGLFFILWGYYLKIFVADNLALIANQAFVKTGPLPGLEVLIASYAFTFQIFGDFAGYSFIALGTARMMGIDLMINFRFPFFVTNPADLWRHWHISLSTWLKDYVYIPLGGNKRGGLQTGRNLMITMVLGGLWHGAAWTFVLWGVYHGVLLTAHRAMKALARGVPPPRGIARGLMNGAAIVLMFHLTCLGFLLFRADSLAHFWTLLCSLKNIGSALYPSARYLLLLILFHIIGMIAIQAVQCKTGDMLITRHLPRPLSWIIIFVLMYSIIMFGEFGGTEFIYFQF